MAETFSKKTISENTQPADLLDIIGTKINFSEDGCISNEEWNKLSKSVQAYSDKRYETARYFFVNKEGQIVRHVSVSSGQPSATSIKPSEDFLYRMRQYATENDCRIVFMHNHPSGYVAPSEADISLTNILENYFVDVDGNRRFLGHIIADHGNFGLYVPNEDKKWNAIINDKIEDVSKINDVYVIQNSDYKIRVQNEDDLMLLKNKAKEIDSGTTWNKDKWVPCFFATQSGVIKSFEHINIQSFEDAAVLKNQLRDIGRENNSDFIYFVPHTREQFFLCEAFAQETNMVQNVYYEFPDGSHEVSGFSGGKLFNSMTVDDIKVQDSDRLIDREELNNILQQKLEKQKPQSYKQSVKKEGEFVKNTSSENINIKENKTMETNETYYPWESYWDRETGKQVYEHGAFRVLRDRELETLDADSISLYKKLYKEDKELYNTNRKEHWLKHHAHSYSSWEEAAVHYDEQLWKNFIVDLKNGYTEMQENGKYQDFLAIYQDKVKDLGPEEKIIITKKMFELSEEGLEKKAFDALENQVKTEYEALKNTKEDYSMEQQDDSLSESNIPSLDDNNEPAAKEIEPEVSSENVKLNEILELLKKNEMEKEALAKQNQSLQILIENMNKKIKNMEEQLNLYKSGIQQPLGEQVKESGSLEKMDESKEIEKKDSEFVFRPGSFNNGTAWTPGQVMPNYGNYDEKTGKLVFLEGYRFAKFVKNKNDPSLDKVIVEKPDADASKGEERQVVLDAQTYREIIRNAEDKERGLAGARKDSWEWYNTVETYKKNMHLDQNSYRSARPENFMHNFRVACRQAKNLDEAMQMAKILVDNMTPYGRKRFNMERKSIGAELFDEKLRKAYIEASQDKEYKDVSLTDGSVDAASKMFIEDAKDHPENYYLRDGEKIADTNTVVGGTIKMSMTFKGVDGKNRKTPASEFIIKKVSKNLSPDQIVLYSEKAKCTYIVPLKDVVSHIKKVERAEEIEKLKQLKKEQKQYKFKKEKKEKDAGRSQ